MTIQAAAISNERVTLASNYCEGDEAISVDLSTFTNQWLVYDYNLRSWKGLVNMRTTFTLELRIDVTDDEQKEIIELALRNAAQVLFSQAALLPNRRAPQIALRTENSFEGQKDLALHEPDNSRE